MEAKVLVVQFRSKEEALVAERSNYEREVGVYVSVDFVSALDESIDWEKPDTIMESYSGLILGGSGEFDFDGGRSLNDRGREMSYVFLKRLSPLFAYVFEYDIPTLGICYGHQIIGAYAGAVVCCDEKQKKTGSHSLNLLVDKNEYFLFADLPDTFMGHYGHKDSLDRVPEGAVLLMNGGERCRVSALRYKNNIYTTQFHPELTKEHMVERIKCSPGYLPEGVVAEEIFKEDPYSNTILHNFGKMVAMRGGGGVQG